MDTISLSWHLKNLDRQHLLYAQAIMREELKAEDLTFVNDERTYAAMQKAHPEQTFCQIEGFLAASIYLLNTPSNLNYLDKILQVFKRQLSHLSVEAEILIYTYLKKLYPQSKEHIKAAQGVYREILKNQNPILPDIFYELSQYPEIAVLKLPYLVANQDYSIFLENKPTNLSKSANKCHHRVCTHLIQNGFAKCLPILLEYLNTLPQKEIGLAEETGVFLSISNLIEKEEQIDTSTFNQFRNILLKKISPQASLEILLSICDAKLVTRTETYRPNMSGQATTITYSYLSDIIRNIATLAQKLNSSETNLYIVRRLKTLTPQGENYALQELAKVLLSPMPPKFDDALEILNFMKQQFTEYNHFLRECLNVIACAFSVNDVYAELTEFKHWAIKLANLRNPRAYEPTDDIVFVTFYADSPYSLDWKQSLPTLLNCRTLKPEVRKDAIIQIATRHAEEVPDFLSREDTSKLAEFKDDLVESWHKLFE